MTKLLFPSRRQFLTTAVSATAAAIVAPSALRQGGLAAAERAPGSARPAIKLGFMTFAFPHWNTERLVEFAKEAGYDGIEIRVDAGHKHEISTKSSKEARRAVRKLFADHGIEIASVATSVQFASAAPDKHRENLKAAKANLDLAADLGAPVVRIFAGGGIPKLSEQAAEQVAAAFDEVGQYAQASGVCPILECGHDIIKGAAEAAQVIQRVRQRNFGVLWNHSTMDDETFTALKGRLRHFHVHDEVLKPDNTNILHLVKRVQPIGYRGYISLEIIHGKNMPEDVMKETATRLKRQIAGRE